MDRSKVSSLLFVSKSMRVRANTLSPYICNARSFLNLKLISAFFQARVRLELQQLIQSGEVRVSLQKYASNDINNETGISPFPFGSRSASQQGLKNHSILQRLLQPLRTTIFLLPLSPKLSLQLNPGYERALSYFFVLVTF